MGSGIVYELLLELFKMEYHSFNFIGYSCNDKLKGLSYVEENDF